MNGTPTTPRAECSTWTRRYSERHRPRRIDRFPEGVRPPRQVRLYRRHEHYLLQWWDRRQKRTLNRRVDGDLLDAIAAARQIDQRLEDARGTSHHAPRRIGFNELIDSFLADLDRRADAGELVPATVRRYRSALAHFQAFLAQPTVADRYGHAAQADRTLALEFAAYLRNQTAEADAIPGRPTLAGPDFVLDVVRAMYQWALDPERGNRLPPDLRNPFVRAVIRRRRTAQAVPDEPDITATMAAELLEACDEHQLTLFAPLIFYGLRPGELTFLFHEHVDDRWVTLPCIERLDHTTKGHRSKRLPLLHPLRQLWIPGEQPRGLVLHRRRVVEGRECPPLHGCDLERLAEAYRKRCHAGGHRGAAERLRIRDAVLRDAGGLRYDDVRREFLALTRRLGWPRQATLKDFRHLFATAMANGGVPEHERRYLMGHAPGRAAIVVYTHLSKIAEHYHAAVERELAEPLRVLAERTRDHENASAAA